MSSRFLLDTNILTRFAFDQTTDHQATVAALDKLTEAGHELCIAGQCLIEFRVVATRPTEANGYGLSSEQAAAEIKVLESAFDLLPDTSDIYPKWRDLVESAKSLGKTNHDARLFAFAVVHGCIGLLTYNVDDFSRYARLVSSTAVVSPAGV